MTCSVTFRAVGEGQQVLDPATWTVVAGVNTPPVATLTGVDLDGFDLGCDRLEITDGRVRFRGPLWTDAVTAHGETILLGRRRWYEAAVLSGFPGSVWAEVLAAAGLTTSLSGGLPIIERVEAGESAADVADRLAAWVVWGEHGGRVYDRLADDLTPVGRLDAEYTATLTAEARVHQLGVRWGPELDKIAWAETGGCRMDGPILDYPDIADADTARSTADRLIGVLSRPQKRIEIEAIDRSLAWELIPGQVWSHLGEPVTVEQVTVTGVRNCITRVRARFGFGLDAILSRVA